jgi:hypothetical protein
MPLVNGYTTVAALKAEISTAWAVGDTADDGSLERAIEACSRWIDHKTGTRFYTTANDETRYYTHPGAYQYGQDSGLFLCPDDILSVTNLYTDPDGDRTYSYTWAATDFDLCPLGAPSNPVGAMPYTWIETTPEGEYTFTFWKKGIKIVGKFGYCAAASVPTDVVRACLLMSQRLWKRKDAVFGVAGMATLGQIQLQIPDDPDILALLLPYIQRNRGPY